MKRAADPARLRHGAADRGVRRRTVDETRDALQSRRVAEALLYTSDDDESTTTDDSASSSGGGAHERKEPLRPRPAVSGASTVLDPPERCDYEPTGKLAARNQTLLDYVERLLGVCDEWLNQGQCPLSVRLSPSAASHLDFLRDWMCSFHGAFLKTGRQTVSLGGMVFYARCKLLHAGQRGQASTAAIVVDIPSETKVLDRMWEVYRLCVHGNIHDVAEWRRRLAALEMDMALAVTYTEGRTFLENAASVYAWTHLQLLYLVSFKPYANARVDELLRSVEPTAQKLRQLRERMLSTQISDVYDNQFKDFVREQYMSCALYERYMRDNPDSSMRTALGTVTNETLMGADRKALKAMLVQDLKEIDTDEKHPLRALLRMSTYAYFFEQQFRVPFLKYYFLSAKQWLGGHALLRKDTRWRQMRRPIITVCLGRWCVFTVNRQMFVCNTVDEAFLVWVALVMRDFQGKLEQGLKIHNLGDIF